MSPICKDCIHNSVNRNLYKLETLEEVMDSVCWGCKYLFEDDYYEEALKACPFCKGTAHIHTHDRGDHYGEDYSVECVSCGVETPLFSTKKEAIQKWNNRV